MTPQRVVSAHAVAAAAAGYWQARVNAKSCKTVDRQVVHASCASTWPQTGHCFIGSLVCQSCSDIAVGGGERERETMVRRRGLFAWSSEHTDSKWTGLIWRLLTVHRVIKRSVMMCLKNKDDVNRMEEKWVRERTGTPATSIHDSYLKWHGHSCVVVA